MRSEVAGESPSREDERVHKLGKPVCRDGQGNQCKGVSGGQGAQQQRDTEKLGTRGLAFIRKLE